MDQELFDLVIQMGRISHNEIHRVKRASEKGLVMQSHLVSGGLSGRKSYRLSQHFVCVHKDGHGLFTQAVDDVFDTNIVEHDCLLEYFFHPTGICFLEEEESMATVGMAKVQFLYGSRTVHTTSYHYFSS